MPKSVIQTSPGLTAGIFVLQTVEHYGLLQSSLIAQVDVRILVGDFQKDFADSPSIRFAELRQFFDNLGSAHEINLDQAPGDVSRIGGKAVGSGVPDASLSCLPKLIGEQKPSIAV
jgi:hypothetical protein